MSLLSHLRIRQISCARIGQVDDIGERTGTA